MALLEVSDLFAGYGAENVLRGVSFSVERGGITAILGANGAGKSSLMKAIAGLAPAAAGRITIDGADISALPAHKRAQMGISMALEGRRLFHRMTVDENLRVAWDFRHRDQSVDDFKRSRERVLAWFPMLAARPDTPAGLLSGDTRSLTEMKASRIYFVNCLKEFRLLFGMRRYKNPPASHFVF